MRLTYPFAFSDYDYHDYESLKDMYGKERAEKQLPWEHFDRQDKAARAVVDYCENDSDCRRVHLLQHFGENFEQEDCNRTCDNCKDQSGMREQDLTQEAKDIVYLVRALSHRNITIDVFRTAFKGSNTAPIRKKGLDKVQGYGKGEHMETDAVELVFQKLGHRGVLMQRLVGVASGGSQGSYKHWYLTVG